MKRFSSLVLLALAAGAAVALAADKPPAACPLLTAAELESAVGTAVRPGIPNEIVIPGGPAKGETMTGCMWGIGQVGMVNLSVVRAPTPAQRDAAMARFREATDRLEARGWKHESTVIGGIHCGTLVPPKNAENEKMPTSVGCMGEAKGVAVAVSTMIKDTKVAPEKVKTLYDDIVQRLP